ncbi:hypothetical protein, partial [Stieleria sp.]|uniref:hypothetical protein n=1 Tax=Stieleria sp. TaxID=2795976 RepID=UPI0035699161
MCFPAQSPHVCFWSIAKPPAGSSTKLWGLYLPHPTLDPHRNMTARILFACLALIPSLCLVADAPAAD